MKRFAFLSFLLAAAALLLNACASSNEVVTETGAQSAATVPGEKIPGEGVTPTTGMGGAGANVHW